MASAEAMTRRTAVALRELAVERRSPGAETDGSGQRHRGEGRRLPAGLPPRAARRFDRGTFPVSGPSRRNGANATATRSHAVAPSTITGPENPRRSPRHDPRACGTRTSSRGRAGRRSLEAAPPSGPARSYRPRAANRIRASTELDTESALRMWCAVVTRFGRSLQVQLGPGGGQPVLQVREQSSRNIEVVQQRPRAKPISGTRPHIVSDGVVVGPDDSLDLEGDPLPFWVHSASMAATTPKLLTVPSCHDQQGARAYFVRYVTCIPKGPLCSPSTSSSWPSSSSWWWCYWPWTATTKSTESGLCTRIVWSIAARCARPDSKAVSITGRRNAVTPPCVCRGHGTRHAFTAVRRPGRDT